MYSKGSLFSISVKLNSNKALYRAKVFASPFSVNCYHDRIKGVALKCLQSRRDTVSGDEAAQVVQFRRSQLPMRQIEITRQLYGDFVPEYKSQGMFRPVHVYVANLVPGPAFCRVRSQFFSPASTMEQRLQQTVQDFARSHATSMVVYVIWLVEERLV